MDGGEERNVPGAWMRGEERKNGSTKGREENRGLVAAQTRSIRPLPPTSPPPPLHDEHEAGQSAELGSCANAPI